MRVIAIGATGFIGRHVINKIVDAGHEVVVLHRDKTPLPVRSGLTEFLGDRSAIREMRGKIRSWSPEVAVDMILSTAAQARATLEALHGIARRIVAISSCDVYRPMAVAHRLETGPLDPVPLTEDSPLRKQPQVYSAETLATARAAFPWINEEYDKVQVEQVISSDPCRRALKNVVF